MRQANRLVHSLLAVIAVLATAPVGPVRAAGTGGCGDALPADVATFLDRRDGCMHWGGEEATDATRGREIATALKAPGRDRLESDETLLHKRYGRSPAVLKALDPTRNRDS